MRPQDFAVANHFVLHVELELFVILWVLILLLRDDIVQDEAARWLVVDHLPEYLSVVDELLIMIGQKMCHLFFGRRLGLLDQQDLALDLHTKHECHRLLAVELVLKVDVGAPSKHAAFLVELNFLDLSELITEVEDCLLSMALREVGNVEPRCVVDFGELILLE